MYPILSNLLSFVSFFNFQIKYIKNNIHSYSFHSDEINLQFVSASSMEFNSFPEKNMEERLATVSCLFFRNW